MLTLTSEKGEGCDMSDWPQRNKKKKVSDSFVPCRWEVRGKRSQFQAGRKSICNKSNNRSLHLWRAEKLVRTHSMSRQVDYNRRRSGYSPVSQIRPNWTVDIRPISNWPVHFCESVPTRATGSWLIGWNLEWFLAHGLTWCVFWLAFLLTTLITWLCELPQPSCQLKPVWPFFSDVAH